MKMEDWTEGDWEAARAYVQKNSQTLTDGSGCRGWKLSLNDGYGTAHVAGVHLAHRFSLALKLGRSIPMGMQARHVWWCPNRHCVEESHLEEGTQKQNEGDKELA